MKSKRLVLKSMEIILGLSKIDDIVDFDVRGMIRSCVEEIEETMKESLKLIKETPYEMKLAIMKFYENGVDLAEAEHGQYFTPENFQDATIKMMSGNPLNMMAMIKNNNIIKN